MYAPSKVVGPTCRQTKQKPLAACPLTSSETKTPGSPNYRLMGPPNYFIVANALGAADPKPLFCRYLFTVHERSMYYLFRRLVQCGESPPKNSLSRTCLKNGLLYSDPLPWAVPRDMKRGVSNIARHTGPNRPLPPQGGAPGLC